MAERRRMLEKVEQPEVYEGEILTAPTQKGNEFEDVQLARKHEINIKVLDSIPDAIKVVSDIVSIYKIKVTSEAELKKMDKEIDKIRATTEEFVRREITKRDSVKSRSESAQNLLRDLYMNLSQLNESDAIKEKVIESFDKTVKIVLEEQSK
jgi:hypothetical protein